MAITKILHISEGKRDPYFRLQRVLNYIAEPDKTGNGKYVGAVCCQPEYALEQMIATKEFFSKTDRRQAYHIIISFEEGEVDADTAFRFMRRFVEEYLGDEYETLYAIHTNTAHIHGHIVFNSVNRITGNKYRYKKGDWAKYMQPITNALCEEYGLSTISLDGQSEEREAYSDWRDDDFMKHLWSDMIRRDINAAILQADDFDDFMRIMTDRGYIFKFNKFLAVKPPGMARYRRCATLGERYSEDAIRKRISEETLLSYQRSNTKPEIIKVRIPGHIKRTKLTGLQRKYFKKLYETGMLIKRPYSQAWKYRDSIRRVKVIQKQYLFLAEYEIHSLEDLKRVSAELDEKRLKLNEKNRELYKEKNSFRHLFRFVKWMDEVRPGAEAYISGDAFFSDEYQKYESYKRALEVRGYTYEEVMKLKSHYEAKRSEYREISLKVSHDKWIAKELIAEYDKKSNEETLSRQSEKVKVRDKGRNM